MSWGRAKAPLPRTRRQLQPPRQRPAAVPAPAATDPATAATPVAPAPAVTGAPAPGFEAGAGLPKSVADAYDAGDVVVLLVVNRKGTEDKQLESEVQALKGGGNTSVFVAEAKDVARYSRIAEGVNLDRVPALVVVEPKQQVEGELPVATISYGYRGPESVQQAVQDVALQGQGPSLPPRLGRAAATFAG